MTTEDHHRGYRWHPAPVRPPEPDLSGVDDEIAEVALRRLGVPLDPWSPFPEGDLAVETMILFILERDLGRPLTPQERNLALLQAKMVGDI